MGVRDVPRAVGLIFLVAFVTGCQSAQPGLGNRLVAHVAMIDFSGLDPAEPIKELKVQAALPQGWTAIPPDSNPLYTHYQWRSPTHMTGVGAAYIHMPLPMSAKSLLWFARAKYSGKGADSKADGRFIGEWTDPIGREWFECENLKYHVKGYAVTDGFDAWVIYTGYRLRGLPNPAEISLAARSMDSIVPLPLVKAESKGE